MSEDRIRALAEDVVGAAISRGQVAKSRVGGRVMVDVTGLDNEAFANVEMLHPAGVSARPAAGADVILIQIGGNRDHKVALAGDNLGNHIGDLAEGEVGLCGLGGQRIVIRADRIEITTGLKLVVNTTGEVDIISAAAVTLTAPTVNIGGAGGKAVVVHGDRTTSGGTCIASTTHATAI